MRKSLKRAVCGLLTVTLLGSAACNGTEPADNLPTGTPAAVTESTQPTPDADVVTSAPEQPSDATNTPAPTATPLPTATPAPVEDKHAASKVLELSFEKDVRDGSSAQNHGTLNKEGTYVEGVSGQALYFDGSTYIDLGTSETLQPSHLTFTAWIKCDSLLQGEHMLAWFKPSGNYQGSGWYLSCLSADIPLKLSVGESTGQPMELYVSANRADFFPEGEWVHIAVTYDSDTKTAAIYRNGLSQTVLHINGTSEITANNTDVKYLGFNSPGYNGGFCNLAMDDLFIYNKVLNASELSELYAGYGMAVNLEEVIRQDYNSLSVPTVSLEHDITLPTMGTSGSKITWTSSNEAVLSSSGKLTRPAAGEADESVTLTATLTYEGYTRTKTFTVSVDALPSFSGLSDFELSQVTLLDAYETNAFALETAYLKSLDADKLLRGFCDIAGVESTATLYGGWENSAIKGHTLGHYLSALSHAYATSKDAELLETINHTIEVLAKCQNPETGYLAAIPESHYAQIEQGNTSGTWVPWYTMHKIIAGLLDAYEFAGNEQALTVVSRLGDWVYSRTSNWSTATQRKVLNVEYGGMNDCLYKLYSFTKSESHLLAAHSFDELSLFDPLYQGKDILNGRHANTTIPKIIGALNRYIVLGESEAYYLQVAENFWDMVVNNHSYITGGNSEWEHFGAPNILDGERTNCNCETCNTYNMLKLSRELFKITGKRKYSDYYENTYINAILSSQNPETGMTTYFQPMATGYFKVYSSPTNHFWCCTDSGMENFSKLGDSIYYKDENSVYITRYTSSALSWKEKNLVITQTSDVPNTDTVTITVATDSKQPVTADIVLRVPDWCDGTPTVTINGTEYTSFSVSNGFLRISRDWKDGDSIHYTLPAKLTAYTLPDNHHAIAFKYGPLVLSADLGKRNMKTSTTGVNVTIPTLEFSVNDTVTVTDGTVEEWLSKLEEQLVRTEGSLTFTLNNTDCDLVFSPHYLQYKNRYGIYFRFRDYTFAETFGEGELYMAVDSLPVANDQYEFSHDLVADKSSTGAIDGHNYRDAAANGYFRYTLSVDDSTSNYLSFTCYSGDAGKSFSILVNGKKLQDITIENNTEEEFYPMILELPADLTKDKEQVIVTFKAGKEAASGGIYDKVSILKKLP